MLATNLALRTRIAANPTVVRLGVAIIGFDALSETTPLPAIILQDNGRKPVRGSALFFRERWGIWILVEHGDDFTLETLADALLADLNQASLDAQAVGTTVGLDLEYLFDGPARPDPVYRIHTKVQYYDVLTQQHTP